MKKSINAQLKALVALKDHPSFGGRGVDFKNAEEAKLMAAIGHTPSATPVRYGVREWAEYFRVTTGPLVARSFAGATAGVVLLLGGWMTSVNAASNSVPGDSLYGLKLITEQVQLRLASLEQRAVLHTEFAERRLQEVATLQQSDSVNEENVRVAFDGFTREVSSANSDLTALQETGSADAVATAGKIEEKLASLDAMLDDSTPTQEAQDASRDAQTAAVAVVVESHAATETTESTQEMQQMFMRQLGELEARQSFDLHRVDVLRKARANDDPRLDAVELPTTSELGITEKKIKSAEVTLNEATATYGNDDFRTAFDMLNGVDGTLQQIEYDMAQAEIAITQAFAEPVVTDSESSLPTTPTQTQATD